MTEWDGPVKESALLIEVPAAEPAVGRWRGRYATAGIPAHVTALYPFRIPPLAPADLDTVAELAVGIDQFAFALTMVEEFPGVLWLRPAPEEPFRVVTRLLSAVFPDCPPYAGEFPDPQPHLTVAKYDPTERAQLMATVAPAVEEHLPIACVADRLSIFASDDEGMWTRMTSFAFRQRAAGA